MSYQTVEQSEHAAQETYLYEVSAPDAAYYWTNSAKAGGETATIGGASVTFRRPRGGITHNEPTESAEAARGSLEVEVAVSNPLVKKYKSFPPPGDTTLTIYRQNEEGGEGYQVWSGVLVETPIEGAKATLTFIHVYEFISSGEGLSDTFGPNCNWILGVAPCPVVLAAYTDALTVEEVDADNLTVTVSGSSRIAGKYRRGVIQAPNGDRRAILNDTVDGSNHVLTLIQNFPSTTLKANDTAQVQMGCQGTRAACQGDFGAHTGNGVAFGGNPIQSNINPHEVGRIQ